jgi:O-antigen/teichoic acid export membrane protein
MGFGYERSAAVIQILAGAFLLNMFARVSSALCMAIEKPEHMMNSSLIMIFSNIVLSMVFIKLIGFSGVAWGTMVAVNAGTIYFLWKLHKNLSIPAGIYLKATWPFCAAGFISGGIILVIDLLLRRSFPHATRVIELANFIATGAVFSMVYLSAVHYAKLFDANDSEFLKDKFPILHRMLRKLFADHGK